MSAGVPTWAVKERWTNRQMLEACLGNVKAAALEEGQLRALYHSLPPGDARLVGDKDHQPLGLQVRRATIEQRHWRAQAAHWRARCVEEGDDALPPSSFDLRRQQRPTTPAPSYIDDPKLDADPVIQAERAARRQAQQELEQLARQAAADGRGDQVEGELPF